MGEPFRFSDLPYDVAFRIIRDYVPVEDKARLLKHLPDFFSPFLDVRSCWYPATRRLHELATLLPPGWYTRPHLLDIRLHVTVDYEHLFFTLQHFMTSALAKPLNLHEESVTWTHLQERLIAIQNPLSWRRLEENDLLHYRYMRTEGSFLTFWIETASRRLVWKMFLESTLENNRCVLEDTFESYALELRDNFQVVLEHRLGAFLYRRDVVLTPIHYCSNAVGPSPLPKTLTSDPTSGIHPYHIEVIRNAHRNDISWIQYRADLSDSDDLCESL